MLTIFKFELKLSNFGWNATVSFFLAHFQAVRSSQDQSGQYLCLISCFRLRPHFSSNKASKLDVHVLFERNRKLIEAFKVLEIFMAMMISNCRVAVSMPISGTKSELYAATCGG